MIIFTKKNSLAYANFSLMSAEMFLGYEKADDNVTLYHPEHLSIHMTENVNHIYCFVCCIQEIIMSVLQLLS